MIHAMNMSIADRSIEMSMDLDPSNQCDIGIIDCCHHNKPIETEVCNVLARVLKEGDCVVDGGANVGFLTILMARLVGETGHVYAFEPGGNNLPKLAANLKLNKIENVEVIDKPLWDKRDIVVKLSEHDHPGYNSLWTDLSKEVTAVRSAASTTLDFELLMKRDRKPKLIKLDIEGAELQALRGASLLFHLKPIIIAELNEAAFDRAGTTIEELRSFMAERGYDAFGLFEDGNLPCFIPRKTRIVTTKMNVNAMFTTMEKVQSLWPEVFI